MSNSESGSGLRLQRLLLAGLLLTYGVIAPAMTLPSTVMPAPAALQFSTGRLALTPAFTVAIRGHDDVRLRAGLARALRRVEERTGLTFAHNSAGEFVVTGDAAAALVVDCAGSGPAVPALGDDESYTLEVTSTQAVLRAPTVVGALHGLETLLQLLQSDRPGWFLPAVSVQDQPRFPWRGLLIDVCRHWQPMAVIKRNLEGMALVKLNVLHLHLTEDQGFRIESRKFPRLHELGSDGQYFTQDEMREIIAYAAQRGIRVVPEFDIPGHATSWVVGHPELASAPGPYVIERKWGVFNPVLDPTNPKLYEMLDGFLGEMAALFPDAYIHIGGDENNGVQWSANPHIQAFIRENKLKDNAGLHAYFNIRVHAILAKYGKKLIGWDEILHPGLPATSVIHSWRGADGIAEATKRGFATVLSNGYYIDLCHPGWEHYLNDPIPAGSALTTEQQKLVLGGEATMWAEWVTPETIDSRIWPRTAAIAERLWSPREVRDVADMYRRLAFVSRRLEEAGLRHESYLAGALRRLAGDNASPADLEALRTLAALLEPVKDYKRSGYQPGATQFTPLTGLVDGVRPDSAPSRELSAAIDQFIAAPRNPEAAAQLTELLTAWHDTAVQLLGRLPALSPRLAEAQSMLTDLAGATAASLRACDALQHDRPLAPDAARDLIAAVGPVAKARAAVELPAGAALARLVAAAAGPDNLPK